MTEPIDKVIVAHSYPVWLPQTQTWMHSQVAELQRLGLDAHVVCERTENLAQFEVKNIHCLEEEPRWYQALDKGLRRFHMRRHLEYLVRIVRETRSRIVHSHFGYVGWADMGAARKTGTKHVVTFYGLDVNKLPVQDPRWRNRYQQMFDEADMFLCEGSHMAQCIIRLGCSERKIRIQHLGVDMDRFAYKPRRWSPGEPLKVLVAASFREKKGIPYAIEAASRLNNEVPVYLTVVGDAGRDREHQAEKARIIRALEESGMQHRTKLMGYQTHETVISLMHDNHIFLSPSVTSSNGDTEGGAPVSIVEALATGMVVVSTRHCDIPEVKGPYLEDLLAKERDVHGLTEILRFVVQHRLAWGKWSSEGRRRMESEYNKKVQAERLLSCYQQLIS